MKARIRIELPPGVGDTPDVRARLVSQVAAQLGCAGGCEHGLEKSERAEVKKLRHRAPQAGIDHAAKLYEQLTRAMIDDIAAALE